MSILALLALGVPSVVRGHGYMTEPPSRQYEAYKANGWPNEVAEYDPHGVAAGGMYADCDGCRSRDWFGPNPWSEPGSAKHLDFVMGGTGGNILGVCGASPSRDNDYNTARPGHWGEEAKTTYKAGDVIDVSWCVSADHGGIPQFRLCDDEGLVSAVTTPDKPPSLADLEALEQCFQRGLLRCDDVDGNDCSQVEVCGEYAADWGACADPGKFLHCRDEKGTEGKYWAYEDHVIYEIANEPNNVAWSRVREYHNEVIGAIRAIDKESIIVAGTTTWSQDIHLAAEDPVAEPYNVMYAFHFYACSHGSLLQRVKDYRTKIPIFVSEWGTSSYSGDGGVCQCEAKEFLDVFSDKDGSGGVTLSMAQWSWADKSESSAALAPGACRNGGDWDSLSESGAFLRAYVRDAIRS